MKSDALYQLVEQSYTAIFLRLVQIDHIVWKIGIYQRIQDQNLAQLEVSDHNQCRLGLWYEQGRGKQFFSHCPAYQQLLEPHQAVHQHGLKALMAYANQDETQGMAHLEAMEIAADQVIHLLNALEADIAKVKAQAE
ncbi:CZB domain-containing protein [Vibrio stylophorae]|uniref:CZB domain-containing protein n=1 Tax=Vibrio stylophorae TaxID=659351 RepID=UPI001F185876